MHLEMISNDYLSDDGLAVLLLCSALGLNQKNSAGVASPLTLSEWNKLESQLSNSPLKSPGGLLGQSASQLSEALSLDPEDPERLARLLDRASRLTLELEKVFSEGMWAVTRVDESYPAKLRETLKHQAPVVLFGAGDLPLLRRPGLAVIGSRTIDERGTLFAQEVGRRAAAARMPVVSGGARGTDRLAMQGALEAGGEAFGVLADALERTIRQPDVRQFLLEGKLVLLTPYAPTAGFSVGAAMGRNKVIYGLADFAVVVSSDFQTGGTWAGATEALKAGWCSVLVREGEEVPRGNRELLRLGAGALMESELGSIENLADWLKQKGGGTAVEADLFGHPLPRRS